MSDTSLPTSVHPPATRGHRLWFLKIVAALAVVALTIIRLQPELERNFKSWLTSGVVILAALLGLIWFLFLSRFRGRTRLATAAALVVGFFGLKAMLRVDGTVNGTGMPKLAWRWSAPHAPHLTAAQSPAGSTLTPSVAALPDVADVPQFFGLHRDGLSPFTRLAHDWNLTPPRQLWRQPIGAGWSAFAVVDGRAYTQEQRGEEEAVTCYELATGKLLWVHTNPVHFDQWQGGDGPRATPTVQEGRVFAVGATGILDCLEAESGRLVWSRDVLKENKLQNLIWGVSASPLVFDDKVVVTGGLTDGPTVLAYRRSDGERLWRAGTDKASYASPILATLAGRRVVLSFNAGSLTAHDPATGDVLLNYPWSDGKMPKAAQPIVIDGHQVFVSAGYGAGCELMEIKAGADGKLVASRVWKNVHMKTQFNSAALREGFLYGLDDGLLACVEIATGARKWKDGRYGSGQTLLAGDLVIIQSEPGPVVLAEARPDGFKELGRIPALSAKTWNYPTLAGRYLLVRNSEEAVCYELPVEKDAVAVGAR
ncbi:MAG: PQQ-binding-like beta-propeller repeat protein [Chthoniobacter sp.]|uniref:PQQ-binding-like beta-propeller repeat protein n=1 Tax=Chthoniobacter sp. TaxID=2510640 RepID=UPI0032AE6E09